MSGKRMEKKSIHNREHGRACPDPQRQRQDSEDGEGRRIDHAAQTESQIAPEVRKQIAGGQGRGRHRVGAESALGCRQRGSEGIAPRQLFEDSLTHLRLAAAGREQLLIAVFDMLAELFDDGFFAGRADRLVREPPADFLFSVGHFPPHDTAHRFDKSLPVAGRSARVEGPTADSPNERHQAVPHNISIL